jgi:acetoin:2,6-dichlorophenolindophenol oxidoreductase subunit alpha
MYRQMLRIRRVQERIDCLYLEDNMRTPVHLCIGQEAIAAGVSKALRTDDYISSNHRSHGHYLAKGGDLKGMMAELHGKRTGCSKGVGGSMHLIDISVGILGCSSIVGGGIPLGVGMALASKMRSEKRVTAVYFGDGAADEGTLYESVNFAVLKKLPVIFVLENNKWAVCSPVESRQAGINIFLKNDDQALLRTARIDGNSADAVFETAASCVDRARRGEGPSFIECDTYRILGHAGCKTQDPEGYRDACEIEAWSAKCPVRRLERVLLESGQMTEEERDAWDAEIASEIDEAIAFAEESPLPTADDLNKHLFCE